MYVPKVSPWYRSKQRVSMFMHKQVHDIAHLNPIRLVDQVSEHEPVRRYELLLDPEGSTFSKGYGKLESSSQPMRVS